MSTTADAVPDNAAKSLAYNLPYPLVALLLVARMARAHPFARGPR